MMMMMRMMKKKKGEGPKEEEGYEEVPMSVSLQMSASTQPRTRSLKFESQIPQITFSPTLGLRIWRPAAGAPQRVWRVTGAHPPSSALNIAMGSELVAINAVPAAGLSTPEVTIQELAAQQRFSFRCEFGLLQ